MDLFGPANKFSLGITGTRNGMRDKQKLVVRFIAGFLLPDEAHHGDCLGADAEFHDIVREETKAIIVVHPPSNPKNRAFKQGDFIMKEKPFMVRDDDIIDESDLMLATPFQFEEQGRGSGTWAVIRHTRKARKPLIIIWPDGTFTAEGDLQNIPNCARMINELRNINQLTKEQTKCPRFFGRKEATYVSEKAH